MEENKYVSLAMPTRASYAERETMNIKRIAAGAGASVVIGSCMILGAGPALAGPTDIVTHGSNYTDPNSTALIGGPQSGDLGTSDIVTRSANEVDLSCYVSFDCAPVN